MACVTIFSAASSKKQSRVEQKWIKKKIPKRKRAAQNSVHVSFYCDCEHQTRISYYANNTAKYVEPLCAVLRCLPPAAGCRWLADAVTFSWMNANVWSRQQQKKWQQNARWMMVRCCRLHCWGMFWTNKKTKLSESCISTAELLTCLSTALSHVLNSNHREILSSKESRGRLLFIYERDFVASLAGMLLIFVPHARCIYLLFSLISRRAYLRFLDVYPVVCMLC